MHEFNRIVLEVTEACPHACLHCYNHWRESRAPLSSPDTLTRREISQLIAKVRLDAPIQQVAFSGGEPLLRPDLPDIVGDLLEQEVSSVVITSGVLLTDDLTSRFPKGTIFEITLFSTNAELHDRIAGRNGAFKKVIAGAVCAHRHRCRVALALVVGRLNAHDVRRTMELGIALGANAVLLNRVNLSRLTFPHGNRLAPSAKQLAHALSDAETVAQEFGVTVAVSVPVPPCVVDPRNYPHLHFGWCPRGGKDAYYTVSHNGLLRPCNHSSVVLGDLRREGFREIVERAKTREFWEPIPPECRDCKHPLADLCRGGCPAASHECYGTRERWDPFINCALAGTQTGTDTTAVAVA